MDEHKDKAAQRPTAEIDTLSNRLHDTIPLAERPVYRRVLRPDGKHVMITTFPPDWWAGLEPRPKATGGTAHVEITPIRPVPLPELCDPARIDAWFTEHFVKHWGMTEGFGARFTALEDGLLRFQFLVDQRFRGHRWSACAHIAQCYTRTIPVLMGATRFQAEELRAIDILGFLGSMVTDEANRDLVIQRTRIAWAHLPATPAAIHAGIIPQKEDHAIVQVKTNQPRTTMEQHNKETPQTDRSSQTSSQSADKPLPPLALAVEAFEEKLRASGITVEVMEPSPTRGLRATFVSARRKPQATE